MSARTVWTGAQRATVIASFLGWMLDAFDFFLVVMVLRRLEQEFGVGAGATSAMLLLTLATRPLGALLFGRLADHYGRKPVLMLSIVSYSLLEFGSAFAPTWTAFLVLRALYGIAMGGEWGVGAALAMETVPPGSRGVLSGLLQSGYPCGYLLAGIVYWAGFDQLGWRGLFMIGAAPALLSLFIWRLVPESPVWRGHGAARTTAPAGAWRRALPTILYAVALMTAFNFFSHGTQDLYPKFLGQQRGFGTATVSRIVIVYNIGAILGGLSIGTLSSRLGRRRAILLAALLALPLLPLWAYARDPLVIAAAAFGVQFMVQGAWGVVPAHLNELSPESMRATFPGLVYQLGNLFASVNAPLQTYLAQHHGSRAAPDGAWALLVVCSIVAVVLAVLAAAGPERRGVSWGASAQG